MANIRSTNDNEAITRLPILLRTASKTASDGWITGPEQAYLDSGSISVIKTQLVRVVPKKALEQFISKETRASFERTFGRVSVESRWQLCFLWGIATAIQENKPDRVKKLVGQAAIATGKLWAGASIIHPWDGIASALNAGIGSAMPVLWQKSESQLAPALLCVDAAQALFAHAVFAITGKFGLKVCRRPACANPFYASRGKQSFCSYRCRVAEAMKRYRKELKARRSRRRKPRSSAKRKA